MSDIDCLLPPNATGPERAIETVIAERTAGIDAPISKIWNADTCPRDLLPWLAWSLSVETWDDGWSEDAKREVLRNSIQVHRLKGTVQSVKAALAAAGYGDAELIERANWNFHDGAATHDGAITYVGPDHWAEYRVRLVRPISLEQAAQVRRILSDVAPARCRLKVLEFTEAHHLYNGQIAHDGQFSHGAA